MGERGPVPKRTTQRRRRNKPEDGAEVTTADGGVRVAPPAADRKWHPVAKRWYESLAGSGQSAYYQASDWATAYLLAESMSRDLRPQPIGVDKDGCPIIEAIPLKGASLAAYLKGMASLMVTEGDRRRARLELTLPEAEEAEEKAGVSELDQWRRRSARTG